MEKPLTLHLYVVLAGLLGAYIVARCLYSVIYALFLSPTRNVPGPFICRFTDLWYLYTAWRGEFEKENIALHEKYGPVVRFGPNRYSIQHPTAIKIIYGTGHEFPKTDRWEAFGSPRYHEWSFLTDRDLKRHAANRRHVNAMYSLSTVVKYESYVDECASVLFDRLAEHSVDDGSDHAVPIDMCRWLQCFAFDVIAKITYAKRIGFLDHGEDVGNVMAALEDLVQHGTLVGIYPWAHHGVFLLKNWWSGQRGTGRKYVVEFTKDIIRNRADLHLPSIVGEKKEPAANDNTGSDHISPIDVGVTEDGRAMDFLGKFWRKYTADPTSFTEYHVLACCLSNMFAGSDTTAIALCAALYYLLRNPHAMRRLRDEIDDFTARGLLSKDNITFAESLEMPYNQAVIKEALRIHPPLGLPMERWVPKGGCTIAGIFFPEGTSVAVNSWVEHRDKTVYGPDANEFRPERWLDQDQEQIADLTRHLIPYGLGSRTCLGRHIAFMEISKLVPNLVRRFDFKLVNEHKHWSTKNILFVKPNDFLVKVYTRDFYKKPMDDKQENEELISI